jgi:DNA repair protein RadC
VLNASEMSLFKVRGITKAHISNIRLYRIFVLRVLEQRILKKNVAKSWPEIIKYYRETIAFETREKFHVLYLDRRNRVIADELLQEGTIDHAPVYVRELVKRILDYAATAIVLVHNHPSGDPTPSFVDIKMTRTIVAALKCIEVIVHDHLIIGKEGHASFKELGLM